ncbi:MAG: thioredoxin family protein [Clostridia bacterium]|nr:thioredoxin family protein [Clostridia bacterium]
MIKHFDEKNFDEALSGNVIVDFYADWCAPCRTMSRVIEDFDRAHPEVLFAKVNIDTAPALAERYGVKSIPTLAFLRNGEVEKMNVGVMTMRALEEEVL